MEVYALFEDGSASPLVFASFDTSPHDDPVRLVFPDIEDLQVRNSARNGCLAAYHLLGDLGYLRRADRFFYSCQFSAPHLNLLVQGGSAGLAFCLKLVQEIHLRHTGAPLPYSVAATGAISDSSRAARVEPVKGINAKIGAALDHLNAGDLVLFPAGNQPELSDALREKAAKQGIQLIPVTCVAQAIEAYLAREERQSRWPWLALAAGVVLVCLAGGLVYYYEFRPLLSEADFFVPQEQGYTRDSVPPQTDLAARLQGKQGLALAIDFHYLGLNKQGQVSLDMPAPGPVALRYGDMYKLACQANQVCYLHIYQIDQQGRVDRLPDPTPEAEVPLLRADTTYYFPSALADWRRVDTVEGNEVLYLLAASAPDDKLEGLYRRYRQAPEENKGEYSRQLRAALQTRMAQQAPEVFSTSFAFAHAPAEPSAKAPPGPDLRLRGDESEQILFVSERYGDKDIFKMNLDGDGQGNLTDYQGADIEPSWSPDGTQIVFQSNRGNVDTENYDLYVMNADGSQVRPLATSSYREQQPSWSPDGQWIAYVRSTTFDDQQIFLMNSDGSEKYPLQPSMLPLNEVRPAWLPNGKYLAFTGVVPGAPASIFIVDPSTGTLNPVLLPIYGFHPSYAPDGTHLVFAANPLRQEDPSTRI